MPTGSENLEWCRYCHCMQHVMQVVRFDLNYQIAMCLTKHDFEFVLHLLRGDERCSL